MHSFQQLQTPQDGYSPGGSLILATDGNYYGTANSGGAFTPPRYAGGAGVIFKMTPSGIVTTLHVFGGLLVDGVTPDGGTPETGLLQGADGNFYGTTEGGGKYSGGTVYKLTLQGVYKVLHSFTGSEGLYPYAPLIQGTDGNFYGTTSYGGTNGYGTAFKMTLSGGVTVLHSFSDSELINPLVQAPDGWFYGTTGGGSSGNPGTVFKVNSAGDYVLLHSFVRSGTEGSRPRGLVLGPGGVFFGMNLADGQYGCGTAFKITSDGTFTLLHSFDGGTYADGAYPVGLILGRDGNFYGETFGCGPSATPPVLLYGTIFKMTPAGEVTLLHTFSDPLGGEYPGGLVQTSNGTLLGVATSGGAAAVAGSPGYGVNFSLTLDGVFTVLHSFMDTNPPYDGAVSGLVDIANESSLVPNPAPLLPSGGLTPGPGGYLYGTTPCGGSTGGLGFSDGQGTAFKVNPAGEVTILHHFGDGNVTYDGEKPNSGFAQGIDGFFYGTTLSGGWEDGAFFRLTPDGTVTTLHPFNNGEVADDGVQPIGELIKGTDGNFYGITAKGGATYDGALYETSPTGVVQTLHSFAHGEVPIGGLVQGTDGDFYGTTQQGGPNQDGMVYRMTPAGVFTVLHQFGLDVMDGIYPAGKLAQGADGALYGVTSLSGMYSGGTVYRITTAGALTILHYFPNENYGPDGFKPLAGLIPLIDGNLAGTTYYGGISVPNLGGTGGGTAFEISTSGTFTLLHQFSDSSVLGEGHFPVGCLYEDASGVLWGETSGGGTGAAGTIYKISKPSQTISFDLISNHLVNDPPFTVQAVASSGLPMVFSVVSGPAKVSGNQVTLTGAPGTVVIQALQVGSPVFAPIRSTRSFIVSLLAQTISFAAIPDQLVTGAPIPLTATASSGLTITYSVRGPATLSGDNLLSITGPGNVSVTASQSGNSVYARAVSITQTFKVSLLSQTINFSPVASTSVSSSSITLHATASSGLPVTYLVVSGPGTISGDRLSLTGPGIIKITASQSGSAQYLRASSITRNISITKAVQTIIFPNVGVVTVGQTVMLNATSSSALPPVYSVTSGNASISGNRLTPTAKGTIRVTANQPGNSFYVAANPVSINILAR